MDEIIDLDDCINSTLPTNEHIFLPSPINSAPTKLSSTSTEEMISSQLKQKYQGNYINLDEDEPAKVMKFEFKHRSPVESLNFDSIILDSHRPSNPRAQVNPSAPVRTSILSNLNPCSSLTLSTPGKKNFPTSIFKANERKEKKDLNSLKQWTKGLHNPSLPEKRPSSKGEEEIMKKLKSDENISKKTAKNLIEPPKFNVTDFVKSQEEINQREAAKAIEEKNKKELEYRASVGPKIAAMQFHESEGSRMKREFDMRMKIKDRLDEFFEFVLGINVFSKKCELKFKSIQNKFRNGQEFIDAFQKPFFNEVFAEVVSAVAQRDMSDFHDLSLEIFESNESFCFLNYIEGIKDQRFSTSVHAEDLVILFSTTIMPDPDQFQKSISDWDQTPEYILSIVEKSKKDHRLKLKILSSDLTYFLKHSCNKFRAIIIETCTTMLREFKMIRLSEFTELTDYIYNPTKQPIVVRRHNFDSFKATLEKFHNESQQDAIINACCIKSGIFLLQGPPGTGKTHTIRGILSTLLTHSKLVDPGFDSCKILVCAPSNTAVDEIANRVLTDKLYKHNGTFIENVNFVRLGNQKKAFFDMREKKKDLKETPEAVLKITLSEQVKKFIQTSDCYKETEEFKRFNEEVFIIKKAIEKYKEEKNNQKIVELQEQLSKKQKAMFQEKFHNKNQKEAVLAAEKRILQAAHVFFTTLSGSGAKELDILVNGIDVVIIDEACQSVELSSLIPFRLNPKIAILVGDPQQLPATTFSSRSHKSLYSRSLFERLQIGGCSLDLLETQYRMVKEICEFSSTQFYSRRLKTFEKVEQVPSWIKSKGIYMFDLETSCESRSQSETSLFNEPEFEFIRDLYWHLGDLHASKLGIGIISPYKKQVEFIRHMLNEQFDDWKFDIEVNTIDGFQGREKDVIIISTVRSGDSVGFLNDARRLNVAVTRARFALWVVGSAKCLRLNTDWNALMDYANKEGKFRKCKSFEDVVLDFTPESGVVGFKDGAGRRRKYEGRERFRGNGRYGGYGGYGGYGHGHGGHGGHAGWNRDKYEKNEKFAGYKRNDRGKKSFEKKNEFRTNNHYNYQKDWSKKSDHSASRWNGNAIKDSRTSNPPLLPTPDLPVCKSGDQGKEYPLKRSNSDTKVSKIEKHRKVNDHNKKSSRHSKKNPGKNLVNQIINRN